MLIKVRINLSKYLIIYLYNEVCNIITDLVTKTQVLTLKLQNKIKQK